MAGVNKVILVGFLGKDPELRYLDQSLAKLSFSLATSEVYKDASGKLIEHTEWHHVVLWRHQAENGSKLLKKGFQVYVEGKLQTRQWTDKQGLKKNITEVVGENFVVLNRKDTSSNSPTSGFESKLDANSDKGGLPY
jgi:single-strand DNA-binding protein